MSENDPKTDEAESKLSISGLGQKIIGEIETIGGVLTGDPITAAEGEFNVEVGSVREELEETAEENEADDAG